MPDQAAGWFTASAQRMSHSGALSHRARHRPSPAGRPRAIARTALELVQSEMLLDGEPAKNLATFVTTWMEPEAREAHRGQPAPQLHRPRRVPADGGDLQPLRSDAPRPLQRAGRAGRARHRLRRLIGGRDARALAMKWRWKNAREAAGQADATGRTSSTAPTCTWSGTSSAATSTSSRGRCRCPRDASPSGPTTWRRRSTRTRSAWSPWSARRSPASATTSSGSTRCSPSSAARDSTCRCTCDAASGGFVFPFSDPDFALGLPARLGPVDQRRPGHKFGLVYPGRRLARLPGRRPAARGARLLRGLPRRARRDLHAQLLRQLRVHPRPVLQLRPPRPGRLPSLVGR